MIRIVGKIGTKVVIVGPKNAVTRNKIVLTADVYGKLLKGENVEIIFNFQPDPIKVLEVEDKVEEVVKTEPEPIFTEEELGTTPSKKKK